MPSFPPSPSGAGVFAGDPLLAAWLQRRAPALYAREADRLDRLGAWVADTLEPQAAYTDRYAPPALEPYDAWGTPDAALAVNESYARCHREAYRLGSVAAAYAHNPPAHLASFASGYLLSLADISIHCPVTLTGALAHALTHWAPAELHARYRPGLLATDGTALTGATWATEVAGGSDVGQTATTAQPAGAGAWRLSGLKFFASNAGAELALATARPAGEADGAKGLGAYLVPTTGPAGGFAEGVQPRRLKPKLGTRGLPTAEIALDGALAWEVAPPPAGIRAMLSALAYSRIHNAAASAAVLRRAVLEAQRWTRQRVAFGEALIAQPMVAHQLCDLAAEAEGALALALEAGWAFDADARGDVATSWQRSLTALAKGWTAARAQAGTAEALELLGGAGYTADWPVERLYRDAMVLPVWEGPANIQALELAEALARGDGGRALAERIQAAAESLPNSAAELRGGLAATAGQAGDLAAGLSRAGAAAPAARDVLFRLAAALASALLAEHGVAEGGAAGERRLALARRLLQRHLAAPPPGDGDGADSRAAILAGL